jgi:hypothetical protein
MYSPALWDHGWNVRYLYDVSWVDRIEANGLTRIN